MPKRNAPEHSERIAWEHVHNKARQVLDTLNPRSVEGRAVQSILGTADVMLGQLAKGIHANPPLTVFSLANPPHGRGAPQLMSRHLYTIEYRHAKNGKDYYHDFKPGTQMLAQSDGSVLIRRPGAKVWVDLP